MLQLHLLQQCRVVVDGALQAEEALIEGSAAFAHGGNPFRLLAQGQQLLGQFAGLPRLHDDAAVLLQNKLGEVAAAARNQHNTSAAGEDSIEFARCHRVFRPGDQANGREIAGGEAFRKALPWLVGQPQDVLELEAGLVGLDLALLGAAADKHKLHGFSLQPVNINVQVHPGYEMVVTVTPDKAGEYGIVCNEYCGIGHHMMVGKIYVVE